MRLGSMIVAIVFTASLSDSLIAQTMDSPWLESQIEQVREELNLVGIGATVVVNGETLASAVSGKRRQNSDVLLTVDDKWHIGSITKSMTATVLGRLVERDVVSWNATLPELLPKLMEESHPDWAKVSLHHVLTHSAGLPANFPMLTQFDRPDARDELHAARRKQLAAVLKSVPASAPGETMTYSNVGYTLAGFIAAEAAGTTWEELMQQELFEPLGLKSAGFGPPVGDKPLDQPWGHQRALFVRSPADPSGLADNSPIIGPAGTVHMSMEDLARYGREHLHGEQNDTPLLKSTTFQRLHSAVIDDYAYGWVVWDRDWADGRTFWHNGSNTFWYALLMLVPSRNAVIVVVTNDGHLSEAQPAFFRLAETITAELPARDE